MTISIPPIISWKKIMISIWLIEEDLLQHHHTYVSHAETFFSEAAAQRCSVKKAFLEILQNSQEKTCARVSFIVNFEHISHLFSSVSFVNFE